MKENRQVSEIINLSIKLVVVQVDNDYIYLKRFYVFDTLL